MAEEEKKKRPKQPTALKRQKQDEKKRLRNKVLKSRVRTATRLFTEAKDEAGKKSSLSALHSLLDKGLKIGIYKRNKVRRLKSKLSQKV